MEPGLSCGELSRLGFGSNKVPFHVWGLGALQHFLLWGCQRSSPVRHGRWNPAKLYRKPGDNLVSARWARASPKPAGPMAEGSEEAATPSSPWRRRIPASFLGRLWEGSRGIFEKLLLFFWALFPVSTSFFYFQLCKETIQMGHFSHHSEVGQKISKLDNIFTLIHWVHRSLGDMPRCHLRSSEREGRKA